MCSKPDIEIPEPEKKIHRMDIGHLSRTALMLANRRSGLQRMNAKRNAPSASRGGTSAGGAGTPAVVAAPANGK